MIISTAQLKWEKLWEIGNVYCKVWNVFIHNLNCLSEENERKPWERDVPVTEKRKEHGAVWWLFWAGLLGRRRCQSDGWIGLGGEREKRGPCAKGGRATGKWNVWDLTYYWLKCRAYLGWNWASDTSKLGTMRGPASLHPSHRHGFLSINCIPWDRRSSWENNWILTSTRFHTYTTMSD